MSSAIVAGRVRGQRKAAVYAGSTAAPLTAHGQRLSGAFQVVLALYVILTGDTPTLVQALAFGLEGEAGSEFGAAMATSITRDLLLLLPVVLLASHPLGILHPLLLAVVIWPLIVAMPHAIETLGGWTGVIMGLPVEVPFFAGLRSRDAATIWIAIAKYNGVEIIALASTYLGYWLFTGQGGLSRKPVQPRNTSAVRNVMLGLLCFSLLTLLVFVFFRGGLGEHLTALGRGRHRELAGTGPILIAIDLGAIALYVWVASRPRDVKSPLFILCLAAVTVSQFVTAGSRSSALLVPIIVGLIWSLRQQRVPWKIALVLLPLMFASIGLLGAIRTSSWYGSTAGEAWSTTGWAESLEVAQQEIAKRRAGSASVPVVARGIEVSDGPMLGKTYFSAVTTLIPRALWNDKPRGVDSIYAQMFFGISREGKGVPLSPEAEMYWNFGLSGVVVLSILYGALLRLAYNFFWRRYPDPFAVVFLVLVVKSFQISSRGLVDLQQQLLLLLVCYFAVSIWVPKGRYTVAPLNMRSAVPPGRALSHQQL